MHLGRNVFVILFGGVQVPFYGQHSILLGVIYYGFVEELSTFEEAGACGTAAVISPIGQIDDLENNVSIQFGNPEVAGEWCTKLYNRLRAIQYGDEADKFGWVKVLEDQAQIQQSKRYEHVLQTLQAERVFLCEPHTHKYSPLSLTVAQRLTI